MVKSGCCLSKISKFFPLNRNRAGFIVLVHTNIDHQIPLDNLEVCTIRRQACLIPKEHLLLDTVEHAGSFFDYSSSADEFCHELHCRFHRLVIHGSFEGSHRKKPRFDKSDERGVHGTSPARPIHRCWKDLLKCSRTTSAKWGGAPSCYNHILCFTFAGTS